MKENQVALQPAAATSCSLAIAAAFVAPNQASREADAATLPTISNAGERTEWARANAGKRES
ncbi:MAG TPA: hypothetical protein VFK45_12455, partial [Gammaproteobacteria bacterium]|nr:hypothetical protein [Gammaproteobacteria bacterium]